MKKILCLLGALLVLNLCGCSQEEVDLVVDAAYSLLAETASDIDDDTADETFPIEENTPAEIPAEPEKTPDVDPEEVPVVEPEPEAVPAPEEDPAPQTDPQEVAYG